MCHIFSQTKQTGLAACSMKDIIMKRLQKGQVYYW